MQIIRNLLQDLNNTSSRATVGPFKERIASILQEMDQVTAVKGHVFFRLGDETAIDGWRMEFDQLYKEFDEERNHLIKRFNAKGLVAENGKIVGFAFHRPEDAGFSSDVIPTMVQKKDRVFSNIQYQPIDDGEEQAWVAFPNPRYKAGSRAATDLRVLENEFPASHRSFESFLLSEFYLDVFDGITIEIFSGHAYLTAPESLRDTIADHSVWQQIRFADFAWAVETHNFQQRLEESIKRGNEAIRAFKGDE